MSKQTINDGDKGLTARGKINDNFTELYGLTESSYGTELTFDVDKDIFKEATGLSITFTLASSGNVNGISIFLRLNKPTAVTFPGTFTEVTGDAFDATKMNVYLLTYYSNWDGAGTAKVTYIRRTFTAV